MCLVMMSANNIFQMNNNFLVGASGVWGRLRRAVSRHDERRFQRPIRHFWPSRLLPGLWFFWKNHGFLCVKVKFVYAENKSMCKFKHEELSFFLFSFSRANLCQVRSVEFVISLFLFFALFFLFIALFFEFNGTVLAPCPSSQVFQEISLS